MKNEKLNDEVKADINQNKLPRSYPEFHGVKHGETPRIKVETPDLGVSTLRNSVVKKLIIKSFFYKPLAYKLPGIEKYPDYE